MTSRIPHGGRYTPEQLAQRAEPTATALERLRGQLSPRFHALQGLREAVRTANAAIGPLNEKVTEQRDIIATRGRERSSAGRAAVREARHELATAQRELTAARNTLTAAQGALERHIVALETDVQARLAAEAPGALDVILKDVRQEAIADREAERNGPDRDVIEAYGAPGTWRRTFNDWNPFDWNGALDLESDSRSVRMNEADRSVTMYQRMRQNYESLFPRGDVRLPGDPYYTDE